MQKNTNKAYRRLSNAEREELSRSLAQGESLCSVAERLGRHPSTLCREIKRNEGRSGYRAFSAGMRAKECLAGRRLGSSKILNSTTLRRYVLEKLIRRWSPEQIAKRIKIQYPHDMAMRVSHEAIYQYIYILPKGELKRTLTKALRQERAYRRKKYKRSKDEETRGKITDMLSIEERPPEVADRIIPGHWEGDLIIGKRKQSALGTLVERTTRTTLLVPLLKKDVASVREAYAKKLQGLPAELRQSLTYDQGKEMSEHRELSAMTGMTVYFAHPGSPWERGTNENTNGLIRQFFPKGTDFRKVSERDIVRVQRLLNGRPRKVLGWRTPSEALQAVLR